VASDAERERRRLDELSFQVWRLREVDGRRLRSLEQEQKRLSDGLDALRAAVDALVQAEANEAYKVSNQVTIMYADVSALQSSHAALVETTQLHIAALNDNAIIKNTDAVVSSISVTQEATP
jgi:predicted  nucleic acid-binding Zn-ribbon protein